LVAKTKFKKKKINRKINIYVIFISSKKKRDFCLYAEKTKYKKGGKKKMNIKTMKENNKVIKKQKTKTKNTLRQSVLKKTYSSIISYLLTVVINSRLYSSSNHVIIFFF
jgi:hypothetical protein